MLKSFKETGDNCLQPFEWQARVIRRFFLSMFEDPEIFRTVITGLFICHNQRILFREMRDFTDQLPSRLSAPILQAMAELNTSSISELPDPRNENAIRNLADFAVLIHRQVSIGFCLQRSLTRYYFLRRAGIPVIVHFGARPDEDNNLGLAGHAWLTLDGEPYYEKSEDWQGYTVILSYPQDDQTLTQ